MIWTPHNWLNKFYDLFMAAVVGTIGIALEFKQILEAILITPS